MQRVYRTRTYTRTQARGRVHRPAHTHTHARTHTHRNIPVHIPNRPIIKSQSVTYYCAKLSHHVDVGENRKSGKGGEKIIYTSRNNSTLNKKKSYCSSAFVRSWYHRYRRTYSNCGGTRHSTRPTRQRSNEEYAEYYKLSRSNNPRIINKTLRFGIHLLYFPTLKKRQRERKEKDSEGTTNSPRDIFPKRNECTSQRKLATRYGRRTDSKSGFCLKLGLFFRSAPPPGAFPGRSPERGRWDCTRPRPCPRCFEATRPP